MEKNGVVTSNHFVTHSSHRYSMFPGDASTRYARRTTDGIDANGRLHSVARAPKSENFREIARGSCLYMLLFVFPRILSRNFVLTYLPTNFNSIISHLTKFYCIFFYLVSTFLSPVLYVYKLIINIFFLIFDIQTYF